MEKNVYNCGSFGSASRPLLPVKAFDVLRDSRCHAFRTGEAMNCPPRTVFPGSMQPRMLDVVGYGRAQGEPDHLRSAGAQSRGLKSVPSRLPLGWKGCIRSPRPTPCCHVSQQRQGGARATRWGRKWILKQCRVFVGPGWPDILCGREVRRIGIAGDWRLNRTERRLPSLSDGQ